MTTRAKHWRMKTLDVMSHFNGDVHQVSALLDCHPQTVRRWVRCGWVDETQSLRLFLHVGGAIDVHAFTPEPSETPRDRDECDDMARENDEVAKRAAVASLSDMYEQEFASGLVNGFGE